MYRRSIISLAWPIAVSSLSFSVMTLVDMYFVGNLGEEVFAGVALAGTIAWVLATLPNGIIKVIKALVATICGSTDGDSTEKERKALVYVSTGWSFAVIIGICYVGIIYAMAPCIASYCETPATAAAAITYLTLRSWGYPILFVQNCVREYQYGIGNTKVTMIATLIGNTLNGILNYVSQEYTDFGLHGIVFATLIGVVVQAGIIIGYQKIQGPLLMRFTRQHIQELFRVGVPQGVQFFLECSAYVVIGLWLSSFSYREMGAHHIVDRILLLSFLVAKAIGEGSAVLAGNTIGNNVFEKVRYISTQTMLLIFFYTAFCAMVFVLFGGQIATLFTRETPTIELVKHLFVYAALFQVFDGAMIAGSCILRGTTDTTFVAITGILITWAIIIPLVWFFGFFLGQGAQGVWIGLSVGAIVKSMVYWHRIMTNKWHKAAQKTCSNMAHL